VKIKVALGNIKIPSIVVAFVIGNIKNPSCSHELRKAMLLVVKNGILNICWINMVIGVGNVDW